MANTLSPEGLLTQLRQLADKPPPEIVANDSLRRDLRDAGRDMSLAMEAGGDAIHRLGSLPLQLAMARIAIEVGLFDNLGKTDQKTWNSESMAKACGVDPPLMTRMMRYLAAFRMVKEIGHDQYEASNTSQALISDGLKAGVNYFFETISPTYMYFPEFLRKNRYMSTYDGKNTPWQLGWNTEMTPFEWLHAHPEHMGFFLPWMMAQRDGMPIWLDVFPFVAELGSNTTPSTPLLVDVGGAMGHQCVAFRERFLGMPGRVILQDLPQVISNVPDLTNIEKMEYNFWETQPIQGTRAYYMRNIMHDWPDDECKLILENTRSAMTKDSVILIDEMVIPSTGASWRATQLDITMITCLAAQERTLEQFNQLFVSAGLKTAKVFRYTEELGDSILVVVPN